MYKIHFNQSLNTKHLVKVYFVILRKTSYAKYQ